MSLETGCSIIVMPYTQQLNNDKFAIERRFVESDGFRQMICDQFDGVDPEGEARRVMAISLHPYLYRRPASDWCARRSAQIHLQESQSVEGNRR